VRIRQISIPTKREVRFGSTKARRWGFTEGLLDSRRIGVFTAHYITHIEIHVKWGLEATMQHDGKTGKVTATIQEITYHNMFTTEAIFELLAEKGILTGEEILERVKKLKSESPVQFRWMQ